MSTIDIDGKRWTIINSQVKPAFKLGKFMVAYNKSDGLYHLIVVRGIGGESLFSHQFASTCMRMANNCPNN